MKLPEKLQKKLGDREVSNSLRKLSVDKKGIDFCSNDYLGFATQRNIFDTTHKILEQKGIFKNGATGSRLLSGNYKLYEETEKELAKFHNAEAALLFNSGYDANVGFFSAIPQRGDIILYDELIHASIRDGIKMSTATSYKFKHNDWGDLQKKLQFVKFDKAGKNKLAEVYIVTESVFSMDGDVPDLQSLATICRDHNYNLIIDEAHATGVYGEQGEGLLQELGLEDMVFARIHTFGKAMGCHGAVILGGKDLKRYLINFARSFIYTTGLPPHSLATILVAYQELQKTSQIKKLKENIVFFNQKLESVNLKTKFIQSNSAIHCCIIPGNENVKKIALHIQKKGFDIKPILSPTVAKNKERLRFCLHSYNSKEEISEVLELLTTFVIT